MDSFQSETKQDRTTDFICCIPTALLLSYQIHNPGPKSAQSGNKTAMIIRGVVHKYVTLNSTK